MTCHCTSLACEDYRVAVLAKAVDRIADRPAAITDRRSAAAFLAWLAGQLAIGLEDAGDEAEED
jgi:hypothetical protein